MADSPLPSWPIIINKSLEESEIYRLLRSKHKVRVTDTTGQGVIIFPLSSVAFMVISLDHALKENEGQTVVSADIVERVQRLNQVHQRAYVILMAALMGSKEMQNLTALQSRFLATKANFIPAHSAKECVDFMVTIAKVTCKPMAGLIQERMKRLQESTVSDNVVLHALGNIGLGNHECLVLQDGLKTVSRVSQATEEELIDCSLDHQTAQKVINFFDKDCIQI
ncbi:protein SPO16 homolog [Porites lutea]|uniref:protein SPO16 homolog n=1 Tax=Porites lutea TaxID=51062 RepID=UPI003CC6B528